jgi:hypothetical protein
MGYKCGEGSTMRGALKKPIIWAYQEVVIDYIVETFTYHHALHSPVKVTPIAIALNPF